jgi:hypothetical protein
MFGMTHLSFFSNDDLLYSDNLASLWGGKGGAGMVSVDWWVIVGGIVSKKGRLTSLLIP